MTHEHPRSTHVQDTLAPVERADDLPGVAAELADAFHELVPSCTAAVAIEVGGRWQLLARSGTVDVLADWRGTLAASTGGGTGPRRGDGYAVENLPTQGARALLILLAERGLELPDDVRDPVASLLGESGRRLDAARAGQEQDRASRRIELLSRVPLDPRPARRTDTLEDAIASLWPHASARFHDLATGRDTTSALQRLARSAHDLDHPMVDSTPGTARMLPPELAYRVAIPFRSRRGALIVDVPASGEPLDNESVAVAHALARAEELREREHALTTEIRTLRREDPETGCAPGAVLTVRLEQALRENARGDVAILLVEIEPKPLGDDRERASLVGQALADAIRRERAEIFRVQQWRFAVVLVGAGSREARLVAQRLQLAVRHAGADGASCSATVGVALAPANGAEASELIDAAEQALQTSAAIAGDASMANTRGRRRTRSNDVFRRVEALRTLAGLAGEALHDGRAHADAVAGRAVRIAQAMHLPAERVQAIQLASELSEIGSLLIRDGALHPSLPAGVLGLDSVAATLSERMLRACGFGEAAEIVASLDERYDGTGTPRGLAGDALPIGSRILAVARDVETTLEGRPRDGGALAAACRRLEAHASRAFDPYVVQVAIRTAEPHEAGRVPLTG